MKKIISAMLAALMIMSLTACGGGNGGAADSGAADSGAADSGAASTPQDDLADVDTGDVANDPAVTRFTQK